jgi:hypothetical protein
MRCLLSLFSRTQGKFAGRAMNGHPEAVRGWSRRGIPGAHGPAKDSLRMEC